jgi:phage shock protein C
MQTPKDARSSAMVFGGAALMLFGAWMFVERSGLIDRRLLELMVQSTQALALIGLGLVIILLSRRRTSMAPRTSRRLYRSRTDHMLGGVLGGLGAFTGIDPTVLRIAVVLLTLVGVQPLIIAYIVMWIVVPEEPLSSPSDARPAPPVPGA